MGHSSNVVFGVANAKLVNIPGMSTLNEGHRPTYKGGTTFIGIKHRHVLQVGVADDWVHTYCHFNGDH